LLDDLSESQLAQMKTLDLKWAYGQFFQQYHLLHTFPVKGWKSLESVKKMNIPLEKWRLMTSNNTLCIEDDKQAQKLK
jgi:hypothetical protein